MNQKRIILTILLCFISLFSQAIGNDEDVFNLLTKSNIQVPFEVCLSNELSQNFHKVEGLSVKVSIYSLNPQLSPQTLVKLCKGASFSLDQENPMGLAETVMYHPSKRMPQSDSLCVELLRSQPLSYNMVSTLRNIIALESPEKWDTLIHKQYIPLQNGLNIHQLIVSLKDLEIGINPKIAYDIFGFSNPDYLCPAQKHKTGWFIVNPPLSNVLLTSKL